MLGIVEESNAILQRVVGMMVPPHTDKSGRIHTRQLVTLPYLNAQREDQIAYYRGYHRYVLPTILYLQAATTNQM